MSTVGFGRLLDQVLTRSPYELSAVVLLQERVGLVERGGCLERFEDLASMPQDRCGLGRSGEPDEAPALAEERERVLGDDPEPLPAIGGLLVGFGGGWEVSSGLGEGRLGRDEGVLSVGTAGLETAHQPLCEFGMTDP